MTAPLAFAVVGPGAIAREFATALRASRAGSVARVYGRSGLRAMAFAKEFGGDVAEDLDDALAPELVDAVYVATPHTAHAEAVSAALDRELPVLCEKPLTTAAAATEALVARSREVGVPLMEAWMYRAHPQMSALLDEVAKGAVGEVREVAAEFTFHATFDAAHRLFAPELGGGAILDVGGYPVSFALAVARAARGGVAPAWSLTGATGAAAPSGVDASAEAVLDLDGIVAHARTGVQGTPRMACRVRGDAGEVSLDQPFLPEGVRSGVRGVLRLRREGHGEEVRIVSDARTAYACEAIAFAELVAAWRAGGGPSPAWPLVDHDETLTIARIADAWRAAVLPAAD